MSVFIEYAVGDRNVKASASKWRINLYPPFLGAGIRAERISDDFMEADVSLIRRPKLILLAQAKAKYGLDSG